jgi:transcriptional regulator with XRE-family HTH domain
VDGAIARFGDEMRSHRLAARLSQRNVAARLGCTQSQVSRLEVGARSPSLDDAKKLDLLFELVDRGHFVGLYQSIVQGVPGPAWVRDWVREVESRAVILRSWDPLLVPGLLQTEAYSEAIFMADPEATADEVKGRVAARMRQKIIFDRDQPPSFQVLIDQGVLHREVGGRDVMREQLEYLHEVAHRPNIIVQIVGAKALLGMAGAFMIATFPGSEPDTVQAESQIGGRISSDPDLARTVWRRYDAIRSWAYRRDESIEMIREGARQWT